MANTETIWLLAPLFLLLSGLLIFRHHRRRTGALAETQSVRARMPSWAVNMERLLWLLLTFAIGFGLLRLLGLFEQTSGLHRRGGDGASALSITAIGLVAVPLGMLLSNWISWLVPPLRKANLQAMAGSNVSFREAVSV